MCRKWLIPVLLVFSLALLLPGVAVGTGLYNGYPVVNLLLDNQFFYPDPPPIIMGGRTMVPLRALAEAFGARVEYNAEANTAIVTDTPLRRLAALEAENQRLKALVAAAAVQPVDGPVVISQVSSHLDPGGYTHVIGVARNTDKVAHNLILVGSFSDLHGKLAAVVSGTLTNLAPDEGRPFDLMYGQPGDLTAGKAVVQVDTIF